MSKKQEKNEECVRVVVRCRPMNSKEKEENRQKVVNVDQSRGEISLINLKGDSGEGPKVYTFDSTFAPEVEQETVYKNTAFPIVESVLEGYNGTIFAYGQTGTGKTHTMEGKDEPKHLRGIIPRTFEHIFKAIKGTPKVQFLVRVSYLELYNEEIRDLLQKNEKKLELREKPGSGIYVKDLSTFMVHDPEELREKLLFGGQNRAVGATNMNQDSSRSHSIFSITVERSELLNGENHIRVGKLNLVDLAGSERQTKTQATGNRLKEAININQSLTTLGNVISALIDNKSTHIPYRDSKLTRLLQDSLGGNTKTVMVANVGPADYNFDETSSTLRYAHRAKSIQNHAKINEDPKDAMIRQFQDEINKLKQQLAQSVDENGNPVTIEAEVIKVEKVITVNDDEKLRLLQQKLDSEKSEYEKKYQSELKKIEEDKKLQENQKQQLKQQLKEKEEREQKQREQQEKLLKKLAKMQEKVIQGDEIMQKAMEKERELIRAQQELDAKRSNQDRLAEEIKRNEELALDLNRRYDSEQEEAKEKTKRVKALIGRLKQIEMENKELEDGYVAEIEDLQERQRALHKELKLKNLLLEYFIPEKELDRLQMRAVYNEELDEWMYPNLHLAGNLMRAQEEKKLEGESEYQEEVQEVLKMEADGHPNVFFVYTEEGPMRQDEVDPQDRKKTATTKKSSAKKRPSSKSSGAPARPQSGRKSTSGGSQSTADVDNYPKAKGLSKR